MAADRGPLIDLMRVNGLDPRGQAVVLGPAAPPGQFDLVCDSGCFHHIAPHRRFTYVERVLPTVRPGGRFGIVAFAAERMETPNDGQIVMSGDAHGGMAFSRDDLEKIFAPLRAIELRAVRSDRAGAFGVDFLNAGSLLIEPPI